MLPCSEYVVRTNQIAALGYVSRTNHITAFGYHAPITAFGYCFLVNDVMETEGCAQRMALTRNLGSFDKCYDCGLCRASSSKVEIYRNMKGSHLFLLSF